MGYENFLWNSLLKPYLRSRLANVALTKSLRRCLTDLLNVEVPSSQERSYKLPKSSRCHSCDWRLNRKTTSACIVCICSLYVSSIGAPFVQTVLTSKISIVEYIE